MKEELTPLESYLDLSFRCDQATFNLAKSQENASSILKDIEPKIIELQRQKAELNSTLVYESSLLRRLEEEKKEAFVAYREYLKESKEDE